MSDEFNQALVVDNYGNFELGNIAHSGLTHDEFAGAEMISWTDKRLAKVVRFRVSIDKAGGRVSVHYVYGELKDGTKVQISPPGLNYYGNSEAGVRKGVVEAAKRDRVFAKGLGVFEALSIMFD